MNIIRASDYFKNRSINYSATYSDVLAILDASERYPGGYSTVNYYLSEFYEEAFLKIPEYCISAPTFQKCLEGLAKEMPSGESRDGEPSVAFLVMIQMVYTIANKVQSHIDGDHVVKNNQLKGMLENAAKRLAYKFVLEGEVFVVAAINPIAEAVAATAGDRNRISLVNGVFSFRAFSF